MFSIERLREIFPKAKSDYLEAIVAAKPLFAANDFSANELRPVHFLAQAGAETGGLTIYEESGKYSASRLLKVFPKYFKSHAEAKAYANQPIAIFNKVYGGRLGNVYPGDGYKFRGRGILQLTGRDAYKHFGDLIDMDLTGNPELAAKPEISIRIAIAYWMSLGLNDWADNDDILAVSRGINGGNPKRNIQPNGMSDRKYWLARIKKIGLGQDAEAAISLAPGTLKEGDESEEVKRLQSLLRAKGYAAGAIDGIYGANTRRAVATFQSDHGLSDASGVWLASYWPQLEAAENIHIERQAATKTDLAEDGPIKGMAWAQRILAFLGIGGAITGGVSEGANNFPALVTQYQPVFDTLSPLFRFISQNGWALVAIAALIAALLIRYAIARLVRAYRHGDYQGEFRRVE